MYRTVVKRGKSEEKEWKVEDREKKGQEKRERWKTERRGKRRTDSGREEERVAGEKNCSERGGRKVFSI